MDMLLPAAVMLLGLVLYILTSGKVAEAGRLAFFSGLFVLTFNLAHAHLLLTH